MENRVCRHYRNCLREWIPVSMAQERGIHSQEIDSQHMDPIMDLSKVILASQGTREMYRKWKGTSILIFQVRKICEHTHIPGRSKKCDYHARNNPGSWLKGIASKIFADKGKQSNWSSQQNSYAEAAKLNSWPEVNKDIGCLWKVFRSPG